MKDQEVIDLLKSEIGEYVHNHPAVPVFQEALKCIRRLSRKVKRLEDSLSAKEELSALEAQYYDYRDLI